MQAIHYQILLTLKTDLRIFSPSPYIRPDAITYVINFFLFCNKTTTKWQATKVTLANLASRQIIQQVVQICTPSNTFPWASARLPPLSINNCTMGCHFFWGGAHSHHQHRQKLMTMQHCNSSPHPAPVLVMLPSKNKHQSYGNKSHQPFANSECKITMQTQTTHHLTAIFTSVS